jgi:CcmD family protein
VAGAARGYDKIGARDKGQGVIMDTMNYLFAAYAVIWLILAAYLFSIHSRESKLRADIEHIKELLERK